MKSQANIAVGGLLIDFDKRLGYLDNTELHITPLEYSLLSLFFRNIGKVLPTKYIIKEIYGIGYLQ